MLLEDGHGLCRKSELTGPSGGADARTHQPWGQHRRLRANATIVPEQTVSHASKCKLEVQSRSLPQPVASWVTSVWKCHCKDSRSDNDVQRGPAQSTVPL